MATDAEVLYLEAISEDCQRVLGAGIEVDAIERGEGEAVTLTLRYRLGERAWTTTGTGDNVIAAHVDLRQRLVEDRLRIAFDVLVKSTP
jgi:hypothetical protein